MTNEAGSLDHVSSDTSSLFQLADSEWIRLTSEQVAHGDK